jgi:hypothetical protein
MNHCNSACNIPYAWEHTKIMCETYFYVSTENTNVAFKRNKRAFTRIFLDVCMFLLPRLGNMERQDDCEGCERKRRSVFKFNFLAFT